MLHDSTPKQYVFNIRYLDEVQERKGGRKRGREGRKKKEKETRRREE